MSIPTPSGEDAEAADAIFVRLFDTHNRRLTRLAASLAATPSAAEDLAHDVFTDVFRRLRRNPRFLAEPAWPYLRVVLARTAARQRRRAAIERRRLALLREPPLPDALEAHLLGAEVRGALAELPVRMRRCAVLAFVEDQPARAIAARLGVSVRTVEAQLFQARLRLERSLRPLVTDDAMTGDPEGRRPRAPRPARLAG